LVFGYRLSVSPQIEGAPIIVVRHAVRIKGGAVCVAFEISVKRTTSADQALQLFEDGLCLFFEGV
jgi:hypothetical protein